MNITLSELAKTAEPKNKHISADELNTYRGGLLLLAAFVQDNFIDLPLLQEDRFDTDGLFYSIPFIHSDNLGSVGNGRMVLVVWKVENKSSYCPLRIDVDFTDSDRYKLTVYDQSGDRTAPHILIEKDGKDYFTGIPNHKTLTLSELVNEFSNTTTALGGI